MTQEDELLNSTGKANSFVSRILISKSFRPSDLRGIFR
jgi:hypothetical protein